MLKIRIRYLSDAVDRLAYIDGKSDWIDLRAAETVSMKRGEHALIPLGVAMALPKGYEAIIAPRSSAFRRYGILQTNSIGVVDETFCGNGDEWKLPVYATRDCRIEANDRIAQFRVLEHQPSVVFEECGTLRGEDRGGFGSTGRK